MALFTASAAAADLPNHIHDGYTVTGSGGFDGVENNTYEFNDIEAIIGIAQNIWPGTGIFEALTGKTTTAFNISNSTLNAYGEVTIINNANHANIGNNNALYAQSNSNVTINAEKVFIAALPSDNKNNYLIPRKDSAITASDNSSVSIAGDVVQIIGNIDIQDEASRVTLDLSGSDSFWLGSSTKKTLNIKLSDGAV